MQSGTIYIYTDASFSKRLSIAVIGYAISAPIEADEWPPLTRDGIKTLKTQEKNNIRTEIRAAITALNLCPKGHKVVLFTDCQTIVLLPERRANLERTQYISQNKNRPLANADIYQEFFKSFDRLQPKLFWVKGHSAKSDRGPIQENFALLDGMVRQTLRKLEKGDDQ